MGNQHAPPLRLLGGGLTALGSVIGFVLLLGQIGLVAAGADPPEDKVTICHRTAAASNPYVQITVAVSAVDGVGGSDHFGRHTGPVFDPAIHEQGDTWGDIIPAIPGVHAGLNWSAQGQAVLEAGCVVTQQTTTTATTTTGTTTTGTTTTGTTTAPTTTETGTTTTGTTTAPTTTETGTTTTPGGTTTETTTGGETTTGTTTTGALVLGETVGGGGGGAEVLGQAGGPGGLAFTGGAPIALGALSALFLLAGTGLLRLARLRDER